MLVLVIHIPMPKLVNLGKDLAIATQASSSLSIRVCSEDLDGDTEGLSVGKLVGLTGKLDGFPNMVGTAVGSRVGVTVGMIMQ